MNINLDDIYVVAYSYICENGEIMNGDRVIVGRENALKVSEDEWEHLRDSDYAHVVTKPATISWSNAIVEDTYAEPIFNRETTEYEGISRDYLCDTD